MLRLGYGMAAGLVVVTLIVLAERLLYSGLLDFSGDYRVAGPFSSMRVGGGHIGAYAALALPFALTLLSLRPRVVGAVLARRRPARRRLYAGGDARPHRVRGRGCGHAGDRRCHGPRADRRGAAPAGIVAVLLVVGGLVAVTAFTGMRVRFADTAGDFTTREGNWQAGLAVRDTGVVPNADRHGSRNLSTSRCWSRSPVNRPSDIVLRRYGGDGVWRCGSKRRSTSARKSSRRAGRCIVHLQARAVDRPNAVGVSLCDKVLLYSDNCQGGEVPLPVVARWEHARSDAPYRGPGRRVRSAVCCIAWSNCRSSVIAAGSRSATFA